MKKVTHKHKKIAIIGAGHMGRALAIGLARAGASQNITVSDRTISRSSGLKRYGIKVTTKNAAAVSDAEIIFLAVKPSSVKEVLLEIRDLAKDSLVVSCAAAVSLHDIERYVRPKQRLARIMPNIPVLYNEGVTGLLLGRYVRVADKAGLVRILSSLGSVVMLKNEKDVDTLTLVSACGPAIVSFLMEMISGYSSRKGISEKDSRMVVMKTFEGTLRHLNQSGISPLELVTSVATKGGVTEVILRTLKKGKIRQRFERSLENGRRRIKDLQGIMRK